MHILKVANGIVEGQVKKVLGKDIVEFLCIPFCKPPVKELRFMRPQPCDTFSNNVINKLNFETCFPQVPLSFINEADQKSKENDLKVRHDEDSLYVNVWCPLTILEGKAKCSVFVWIHGGGLFSGSSSFNIYRGDILAAHENIIVVSFNYRLAMLGFLCLDDMGIHGNLGIWDQVCALKWIHENISSFNGDPENITLVGNSAGGLSVSLHLLIEESWPCFQKAVILSGVCISDWACHSKEEMVSRSVTVINRILDRFQFPFRWQKDISFEKKKSIVGFLQSLMPQEFLIDYEAAEGLLQLTWTPCIDGELLKGQPRTLIRDGHFKRCPVIVSNSENEASFFVTLFFPHLETDEDLMVDVKYLKDSFQYYPCFPSKCEESTLDKIKKEYLVEREKLSIHVLDKIVSDVHFVCDSIQLVRDVSRVNPYIYYLCHKNFSPLPFFGNHKGAYHISEIRYLFGHYVMDPCSSDASHAEHSKTFMCHIGKFVKEGHLGANLSYFDEGSKAFIVIDENGWRKEHFSEDQFAKVDFWMNLRQCL